MESRHIAPANTVRADWRAHRYGSMRYEDTYHSSMRYEDAYITEHEVSMRYEDTYTASSREQRVRVL